MNLSTLVKKLATGFVVMLGVFLCRNIFDFPAIVPVRAASGEIQIWVEGPWAYAVDPRSGTSGIVLIAPNPDDIDHTAPAIGHRKGDFEFPSGSVLSFVNQQPNPTASSINMPIVNFGRQALIDMLNGGRTDYRAIFLPKPDWYEESVQTESRIRSKWWSDCVPHSTCASTVLKTNQMILHYAVSSLPPTFKVGLPGKEQTFYLRDSNVITIFMTAVGQMDPCDSDGRSAFHGLMSLFSATLYVDLKDDMGSYPTDDPHDTEGCLADDPQNPDNNDPSKPALRITHSLSRALDDLADYIVTPKKENAEKARANWNQIRRANKLSGPTEGDKRKQFDKNMTTVDSYLTSLEARRRKPSVKANQGDALIGLEAAKKSIPFHNGSGACRNPLIELNLK